MNIFLFPEYVVPVIFSAPSKLYKMQSQNRSTGTVTYCLFVFSCLCVFLSLPSLNYLHRQQALAMCQYWPCPFWGRAGVGLVMGRPGVRWSGTALIYTYHSPRPLACVLHQWDGRTDEDRKRGDFAPFTTAYHFTDVYFGRKLNSSEASVGNVQLKDSSNLNTHCS